MCPICHSLMLSVYYIKDSNGFFKNLHARGIIYYGGEKIKENKSYCKKCNKLFNQLAYNPYFKWLEFLMLCLNSYKEEI